MLTVKYDTITGKLVDAAGQRLASDALRIAYQENPTWRVQFVVADPVGQTSTPVDVSGAVSWASAIDNNFVHASDPMTRTLNADIDATDAANGNIDVTIDANTATFLAAVTGENFIRTAYFELRGLSAGGAMLFYAKFNILSDNTLDPSGGTPPDPVGNYYTKTEVDALLPAALAPVEMSGDTTLTAVAGEKVWIVDTSGASSTLTLQASATYASFRPVIVKINAANSIILVPDGAETINGVAGPYSFTTANAEVRLYPVTAGWRCALPVLP